MDEEKCKALTCLYSALHSSYIYRFGVLHSTPEGSSVHIFSVERALPHSIFQHFSYRDIFCVVTVQLLSIRRADEEFVKQLSIIRSICDQND